MKCHVFTGEGLPVGWLEVQSTQPFSSIATRFYPNACYWLIRPTMLLFRWPADVGIGEFDDAQKFQEYMEARTEIDALNFYVHVADTGKHLEISCHCIEELDSGHVFHGWFADAQRL